MAFISTMTLLPLVTGTGTLIMKILKTLAALALAAPVAAYAEEGKPSLDDRFFKAFYQENGLRDFEKAAALYAEVAGAARMALPGDGSIEHPWMSLP